MATSEARSTITAARVAGSVITRTRAATSTITRPTAVSLIRSDRSH